MPKLGLLPSFADFDGDEQVVMAKAGAVGRGAIGALISAIIAPFVAQAQSAASVATAAAEFAFARDIFADEDAGVADTAPGTYFFTPGWEADDFLVLWYHGLDGTPVELAHSPSRDLLAALEAAASLAQAAAADATGKAALAETAAALADDKAEDASTAASVALAAAAAANAARDALAIAPVRHTVDVDELSTYQLPVPPLLGLLVIVNGVILDVDDFVVVGSTIAFVDPLIRNDRLLVLPFQSLLAANVALENVVGLSGSITSLRERAINLLDFDDDGAAGTGGDDSGLFQTACASGRRIIHVTPRPGSDVTTYVIAAAPTDLTHPVQFHVHPGALLTGAGAAAMGYYNGGRYQILEPFTTPNMFASFYIRRTANHVGGDPGYAARAMGVDLRVGKYATDFQWAACFTVRSAADGGQNVGVYGQGTKIGDGIGPVWGGCFEAIDETYTQSAGKDALIGIEVDSYANGPDSAANRVGVLLVSGDAYFNRTGSPGLAGDSHSGIRILAQDGGTINPWRNGVVVYSATDTAFQAVGNGLRAFRLTGSVNIGLDLSEGICATAAIRMKQDQPIIFDALNTNKLYFDGYGLRHATGGGNTLRSRLRSDGTIETQVFTAGTLPTPGVPGRRTMVADATATAFYSIVSGGGGNMVPVLDTGAVWVIG